MTMPKHPRDPIQLAKQVFDIATGETEDTVSESKRNPSKRRAAGLKGGNARAAAPYADDLAPRSIGNPAVRCFDE